MIAMQRHPLETTVGTRQQLDQRDDGAAKLVSGKVILVSGRRTLNPNHLGQSRCSEYRSGNAPHDPPFAQARAARQGLLYCASAEAALSRQAGHVMWLIPFVLGKRPKKEWSSAVVWLRGKGGAIDCKFTHTTQYAMASRCLIWKLYLRQGKFCRFSRSPQAWYGSAPLHESISNE
jgi:hypothetical protein